jgi:hypothetical protein
MVNERKIIYKPNYFWQKLAKKLPTFKLPRNKKNWNTNTEEQKRRESLLCVV